MTVSLSNNTLLETTVADPVRTPSSPAARVALRRPGGVGTYVDGGWWPHSLNLVDELPALLSTVEAAGYGEIRRISFALDAWDGQPPRRAMMLHRIIKLGGFRSQDPAEISLVDSGGWKRVTLLVVPPTATAERAERALAMAGTDGDPHHAREILDLVEADGAGTS